MKVKCIQKPRDLKLEVQNDLFDVVVQDKFSRDTLSVQTASPVPNSEN